MWSNLSTGLHALKRALAASPQPSDRQLVGSVTVTLQDLHWALTVVKPSAMREVAIDVPKVQLLVLSLVVSPRCLSPF